MFRQRLPVLAFALVLAGCNPGSSSGPAGSCETQAAILSTQSVHPKSFNSAIERFLVKSASGEWRSEILPAGASRDGEIARLLREGARRIEPDFKIQIEAVNDPQIAAQWAHAKVHSAEAWALTQGNRKVVVGIVDGGVDINHPDLAANIWTNRGESAGVIDHDGNGYKGDVHGWDFIHNDADPRPDSNTHVHGTHVAGSIGAVGGNGIGVAGEALQVQLMPLKFIGTDGSGSTSDAIRAIDYGIKNGAHVLNMSWASSDFSSALYEALQRARAAGILVVAAAGNDGQNADHYPQYPAAYGLDNIISVAATGESDQLAAFSNFGATSVDVAAPGLSILSTFPGGGYGSLSGTSMASPLVAGLAALVKARHFDFSYAKISAAIKEGADMVAGLRGKLRWGGRVNAYRTLLAADAIERDPLGHTLPPPAATCPVH